MDEPSELRQKTIAIAKKHKASWIELGQYLYTIHKDKHYKSWGYLSFQTYCKKELSIKETTAAKLMKSYHFLEKEEPRMVSPTFLEKEESAKIPDYEAVNVLRLAKQNQKINTGDFSDLREAVLNAAKEPQEIRAQIKQILEDRDEREPDEIQRSKRNASIKRLVTMLSSMKKQMESEKLLPAYLIKQMADLAGKLEDQLEE
ncbi:MAG: hypothetical protein JW893_04590 [Candidatus Omnitrophica bacterium]|nr:hypothetical protein [Candidatus Omnitrophota bacterium]